MIQNNLNVHFNLVQSKILTETELESLKMYLQRNHVPNHRGNTSRGIGDIYDLEYVIETHNELADNVSHEKILFCEGFEVVKKLFNDDIAFIEV